MKLLLTIIVLFMALTLQANRAPFDPVTQTPIAVAAINPEYGILIAPTLAQAEYDNMVQMCNLGFCINYRQPGQLIWGPGTTYWAFYTNGDVIQIIPQQSH